MTTETYAKATLRQRADARTHRVRDPHRLPLRHSRGSDPDEGRRCCTTEGISFAPWGIAIVKAVVLAKFVLLGHAMKIGERYSTRPLIWPTLHKAFAFLVLLVVLTIIEEVVVGLFHHQTVAASLDELVRRQA